MDLILAVDDRNHKCIFRQFVVSCSGAREPSWTIIPATSHYNHLTPLAGILIIACPVQSVSTNIDNSVIFDCSLFFKGVWHEIFDFRFFSWISVPQAPMYSFGAVLNFFENSRRYSRINIYRGVNVNCSAVSTTPAKNLSPVSTTPAIN